MLLSKLKIAAVLLLPIGVLTLSAGGQDAARSVAVMRVPDRGIQPQVAVDAKGIVHLLYFKGEPGGGDVYYARSEDGQQFKQPMRVNSQLGSVVATGNIRGAHLALGKNGRVHVAWNGSHKALPKAPGNGSPMLYARLDDAGAAFESQRNLIQSAPGLDGGGSVCADGAGNVYVFWHAPEPGKKGEVNRGVWMAASTDDGKTFAAETPANAEPTGACGCCGLRAFADSKGTVYALYRGAKTVAQRDIFLLTSANQGKSFKCEDIHPWSVDICPMSSEAFAEGPGGVVIAAWETKGQVYFARIDPANRKRSAPIAAPGAGQGRKHPAVAVNAKGEMILVWTEGMGWNKGGSVAWQVYERNGTPTKERGQADGVPVWSLVAAYVRPDGRFAVMGALSDAKRDLAQMQAGTLTTACQAYALKNKGEWPESLKTLLQDDGKGGPWLEGRDALKDPWGQQFMYDRAGPKNNGRKPDIWTKGPDGVEIGNWPVNVK